MNYKNDFNISIIATVSTALENAFRGIMKKVSGSLFIIVCMGLFIPTIHCSALSLEPLKEENQERSYMYLEYERLAVKLLNSGTEPHKAGRNHTLEADNPGKGDHPGVTYFLRSGSKTVKVELVPNGDYLRVGVTYYISILGRYREEKIKMSPSIRASFNNAIKKYQSDDEKKDVEVHQDYLKSFFEF